MPAADTAQLHEVYILRPGSPKSQSTCRDSEPCLSSQPLYKQMRKVIAALPVFVCRHPEITVYFSIGNKFRQRQFGQYIAMPVEDTKKLFHFMDKGLGCHYKSRTETRRQRTAKRTHIYDHALPINTCQRQLWMTIIMEIEIVVVLDNDKAILQRKGEQFGTTLRTEGNGGGIMVVRG